MKLCLFGGSFDPVHGGHLHIAQAAYETCTLDKMLFLPAACSPFKQGRRTMFTDEQRMKLLQLATAHLPWAEVSALDLELPPPSWSWRLVEIMLQQYPDAELYWLLGSDQWDALHRWARYDYLTQHLHFIIYHRGAPPMQRNDARGTFIRGHHPASSTAIREAFLKGTPLPEGWLSQEVEHQARCYLHIGYGASESSKADNG